ncbi:hypothetical protein ELB75_01370 [Eikenella corrodens]|uniref:Uncharacterized protein n=1 Tax=Eikenella corrodens TaxID=539 RepID=A0A3S9SMK5_EIKCO|nr:hypothetical protein ELB75_01370 [Eikenella corrodens]
MLCGASCRLPEKCRLYSELNLNQYSVDSPCRTICTVCGSPPCPDLNLIHYIFVERKCRTAAGLGLTPSENA